MIFLRSPILLQMLENITNIKTLTTLSFSPQINPSDHINSFTHKNTHYNIIHTHTLSKPDQLYALKFSHLCLIFLHNDNIHLNVPELKNFIFIQLGDDVKKFVKRYGQKAIKLDQLKNTLEKKNIYREFIRPVFVPVKFWAENGVYKAFGFMDKFLMSKFLMKNGRELVEILKVEVNGKEVVDFDINEDINKNIGLTEQFNDSAEQENDNKMEIDDESGSENKEKFNNENINDGSFDEENDNSEYSENDFDSKDSSDEANQEISENNLIKKFKNYSAIKNTNTLTLENTNFPPHYSSINIIKNIKSIENRIKKIKHPLNGSFVEITFKNCKPENFMVFCNVLECENLKTIYNFRDFKANENNLTIDLGCRIVDVKTTRSIRNGNIFKVKNTENAILSFIAPFSFFIEKAYIINEDKPEINFKSIEQDNQLLKKENFGNEMLQNHENDFFNIKANKTINFIEVINPTKILFDGYYDPALFLEKTINGKITKREGKTYTVKKMFSSKDEVNYFKNVPVFVNNFEGMIKKSIGEKGVFKVWFGKTINGEKVEMRLYKRVFLDDYIFEIY